MMRAPYSLRTILLCALTFVSFLLTGTVFTRITRNERTYIILPSPDIASARTRLDAPRTNSVNVRIVANIVATETTAVERGHIQPNRPETPPPRRTAPAETPTPTKLAAPDPKDIIVQSVILPAPATEYDYMITPLPEIAESGVLTVGEITPTLRFDVAALITPVLDAGSATLLATPSPLDSPLPLPVITPTVIVEPTLEPTATQEFTPLISPLSSPLSLPE